MKTVKEFTIKRSKWLRGDDLNSCLLKKNGHKCCLGFYGQALGVSNAAMRDVGSPCESDGYKEKAPEWMLHLGNKLDSTITEKLMRINDEYCLPQAQREKDIAKIFKEQGVKVKFVD